MREAKRRKDERKVNKVLCRIRDLFGRDEYTNAVVEFLMSTKVRKVKEGVIQR